MITTIEEALDQNKRLVNEAFEMEKSFSLCRAELKTTRLKLEQAQAEKMISEKQLEIFKLQMSVHESKSNFENSHDSQLIADLRRKLSEREEQNKILVRELEYRSEINMKLEKDVAFINNELMLREKSLKDLNEILYENKVVNGKLDNKFLEIQQKWLALQRSYNEFLDKTTQDGNLSNNAIIKLKDINIKLAEKLSQQQDSIKK